MTPDQKALEQRLRDWRKAEASKTGKSAFIVFSDAVLAGIVQAQPQTLADLQTLSGIGPEKADRYGATVIAICRGERPISDLASSSSHTQRSQLKKPRERTGNSRARFSGPRELQERFRNEAENLRYLNPASTAGRIRAEKYVDSAYKRMDFEEDLRKFAQEQAAILKLDFASILSEAAIAELLRFKPCNKEELDRLAHLRGDLSDDFYEDLVRVCQSDYTAEGSKQQSVPVKRDVVQDIYVRHSSSSSNATATTKPLTPDQQLLDSRLRAWRASEAERLGLPQFFVLGTSTLRNIAMERPRTLTELKMIDGVSLEKAEKFGSSIIEICME